MINANPHKRVEKFVAMTCITTKFLKVNFMLNLESSTNLELAEYQFQLLYSQWSEFSFPVAIPKALRLRKHVVRIKATVGIWKFFNEMHESRGIAMFAKDILN